MRKGSFAALLLLWGLMATAKKDLIAVDGFEVDSSSIICGDGVMGRCRC